MNFAARLISIKQTQHFLLLLFSLVLLALTAPAAFAQASSTDEIRAHYQAALAARSNNELDCAQYHARLALSLAEKVSAQALPMPLSELCELNIELLMQLRAIDGNNSYALLAWQLSERAHGRQVMPAALSEIQQQLLDADSTLLEYFLGREHSYLWVVNSSSLHMYALPPRAEIEDAAQDLYQDLIAPALNVAGETVAARDARIAQAEAEYPRVAAKVTDMILAPAGEIKATRLLIVADGIMQYIPFSALAEPCNNEFSPLARAHEIISISSAQLLGGKPAEQIARPATLAIFADPVYENDDPRIARSTGRKSSLRTSRTSRIMRMRGKMSHADPALARLISSREEAQAIANLLPAQESWLALDFAANRAAIMNGQLSRYRLIHFATHAIINESNPEESGLVLSLLDEQGQPQDGLLRLSDICGLKLSADLVVLSGCQTALPLGRQSDALIGIARSFITAGAPQVIASLWRVQDDATAEFMTELYRGMAQEHRSPSAALRAAQLAMLQNKRRQFPYYWAAFTLIGR